MIKIRVPATSANVGPGFDVFGLAVKLYNEFTFRDSNKFKDNNLVYYAYKETFKELGKELIPVSIHISSGIPMTRGLGSSSTCIVAGVAAALQKIQGEVSPKTLLEISSKLEGHPDNVAPAILGSLVASVMDQGKVYPVRYKVHDDLRFLTIIPNFKVSTSDARGVLPEQIPYSDAINNISRAALLPMALAQLDEEVIRIALEDKLHEPYRMGLIKGFPEVKEKALEYGALGVYLSGAGPTMMALTKVGSDVKHHLENYLASAGYNWEIKELELDDQGVVIESL